MTNRNDRYKIYDTFSIGRKIRDNWIDTFYLDSDISSLQERIKLWKKPESV